MQHQAIEDNFVMIIFGGSGDLAKIKLYPSLFDLFQKQKFHGEFAIYGYGRSKKSPEEFRNLVKSSLNKKHSQADPKKVKEFLSHCHYFSGSYDEKDDFLNLFTDIKDHGFDAEVRKIAYFSVPPQVFEPLITGLGQIRTKAQQNIQLIIEKPFGTDGNSARDLFHKVSQDFDEDRDIYLLDHYLGKRGVQSILPLRYDNSILSLMLKGSVIKDIQITVKENFGIEERAGYFDQVGVLKDMIQSHLLQILALITMYIPVVNSPRNIHREKFNILSALRYPGGNENIVLGQYASYRTEKDVPPSSLTPTFTALRLYIDQADWFKVPIYLRTGKKLDKRIAYCVVEFKKLPFQKGNEVPSNKLILELQPDEKIHIRLVKKQAGSNKIRYDDIVTSDNLSCEGGECLDEHGRLFLEMLNNDKTNFLSFPEILECWRLTDFIYRSIERTKSPLTIYHDNTKGPEAQNKLTETDNNNWYEL